MVFLLVTTIAFAQRSNKAIEGNPGMYPNFVTFATGSAPGFIKGKIPFTDGLARVTVSSTATVAGHEKDAGGAEHFRYQQTINGIPVEHAIYIVHAKNDKVFAENGKWIKDIPPSLPTPVLSVSSALQFALKFVNARSYKWQDANEEAFLKEEQNNVNASFYPIGKLVFYSGEEEVIPSALRPAYKFDIYASNPVSRQMVFVDAVNGDILGKRELLHTTNSTGTAITVYSGTQPITTDHTGTTYRLRETGRGNGIQTFNLKKGINYSAAVDFTDANNNWNNVNTNQDQYATDAHWGAEKTYDYYFSRYGRNSIDNAGMAIKSYVHYSTGYLNAFWDGTRMTYGDGDDSDGNKPLTALDICGHEITHGLTSFTSNLNYSYEPGALNEGFSDIFGTAIEAFARPTAWDWIIAGDVHPLRSMSNPKQFGQPDTYKKTNWSDGPGDYGGVHKNSGVLNFWFYLLAQGKNGTNDNGLVYSVTGIGINKAAAIAYLTNTVYLVSTSGYADARAASIQAAADLYGVASNEVKQTTNAWDAVGVEGPPPPPPCSDNFEPNNTRLGAKAIPVNIDNAAMLNSPTDKDWFTFTTVAPVSRVRIDLTNLPNDYDLRLYSSPEVLVASSVNGGTDNEVIIRNVTTGQKYYLQVYGYNGAFSANCYTLQVSTSSTNFFRAGIAEGLAGVVKQDDIKGHGFAVYPNPARDKLTVYVNAENSSRTELSLVDVTGRTIVKQSVQIQKGVNIIPVNIPGVTAGTYIIKMAGLKSVKVQIVQ